MRTFVFWSAGSCLLLIMLLGSCVGANQKAGSVPLGFDARNRYDRRDRPQGRWRTYYDSARTQPYTTGRYRHGRPVRTFRYFDPGGALGKSEQYGRAGNCVVTDWYAGSRPARRGRAQWLTGSKGARFFWFGPWVSFSEQGDTTALDTYVNGTQTTRIGFKNGRRATLETYDSPDGSPSIQRLR